MSEAIDTQTPPDAAEAVNIPAETLPWWRSKLNLGVLGVVLALVAGSLGFVIGNNRNVPDPNAADVGFLQDMHWHHDQAVELSLTYLSRPGTKPELQTLAREILVGQSQEIGMMIELLRTWGRPEINDTDIAMGWMGDPIALDRMPGLASDQDISALGRSSGSTADTLFVTLMVAHHEGGIHMAEAAATRAGIGEVVTMARQMATSQREEINEMKALLGG